MLWVISILALLFLFWRFFWFFRDPERTPPAGDGILSPADGFVVYVRRVERGEVPIAVKGKKQIRLKEINGLAPEFEDGWLIGIFMSVLDVHVNRIPIDGHVVARRYIEAAKNKTMARLFLNLLVGGVLKTESGPHLYQNERNTLLIRNKKVTVSVTQIADAMVDRIRCWVREGDTVNRGQRFGMIRMGSQCDLFIRALDPHCIIEPRCHQGQHVTAGETVVAEIRDGDKLQLD